MSQVSNVLLTFSVSEQTSRIEEVNLFFTRRGYKHGLVSIEDDALPAGWYGGNKPFEHEVLVGAFNFLDADSFINHLQSIQWADRAGVQVFVLGQEDIRFQVTTL